MKVDYRYAIILAFFWMTACVAPVKPQSVGDQVALAQATLTGAYQSIADLRASQSITAAEYETLMDMAGLDGRENRPDERCATGCLILSQTGELDPSTATDETSGGQEMTDALLVTTRLLSLTTALMNISLEIQHLNMMMQKAHDEGRELNEQDWADLDSKLAQAKANAVAAGST